MARIVIASTRPDAGKTTVVVGLGRALHGRFGYLKPLGDRLLYKKKQLWDYDCALVVSLFSKDLTEHLLPIGFDQSKLRYMYSREAIGEKLASMLAKAEQGHDHVFIEAGRDLAYGGFVFMDPVSVARAAKARLVLVVEGNENKILDDVSFIKNHLDLEGVQFGGIVVNKVPNLEDFKSAYLGEIASLGVPVLGAIPFEPDLTHLTADNIAQKVVAKVLCAEDHLHVTVKHVFVGAMSAESVLRHPLFQKEQILLITSGDRTDMLLAALEQDVVAVILTNNVIPPAQIVNRYGEKGVPLLLTADDTYGVAQAVHAIEPLLSKDDAIRVELIERLVRDHVDLDAVLGKRP